MPDSSWATRSGKPNFVEEFRNRGDHSFDSFINRFDGMLFIRLNALDTFKFRYRQTAPG